MEFILSLFFKRYQPGINVVQVESKTAQLKQSAKGMYKPDPLNAPTTYAWHHKADKRVRKDGATDRLTEYDAAELLKYRLSQDTAAKIKPFWYEDTTAKDVAGLKIYGAQSTIEKCFAAFSSALRNEMAATNLQHTVEI